MQLKIYQENAIDDLLTKAKQLLGYSDSKKLVFKSPTGSGEHINKEEVEKPDNYVEVLLFKQAIALGWDCPRAQILVLFRQWHSPIFSIQTVGRIMRMPEPDKGHYGNEILNYGYVYTNLDNIEIQEDIAKDYITIYTGKRRVDYKPINLLSCYSKRHREKTRLSPLFQEIFLKQAKEYDLKRHINTKSKKFDLKIISDYKAEDVDAWVGAKISGDKKLRASGFDLQKLLDFFVRNNLTPFYPEDRSVKRVEESIYKFFEKDWERIADKWEEIVQIVLSEKNARHFVNVLDKAKEKYQAEVVKRESEMIYVENWNIKESYPFNETYIKEDRKKSILQPFYAQYRSDLEKAFVDFLEKSEKVEWWFKNGDRDAAFFAVPYDNGEKKPFYVDFIVKLKDGRIGLFDTKAGLIKQVAGPKIDGLYKYIQTESKKGKKLFGGIVANTERNYRGRWVYFDKASKDFKDNSFDNWIDLIL